MRPILPMNETMTAPRLRFMRLWLRLPDWVFRAAGAIFFLGYLGSQAAGYADFPRVGPYIDETDDLGRVIPGAVRYFPAARILTDLTFLLIALAFVVRTVPRRRADSPRKIIIPLIAAFWPLLPFMLHSILQFFGSDAAHVLGGRLQFGSITYPRFYAGCTLIVIGNSLDVWGYATLLRSLSIVAEARELRLKGPYRIVRHPIYLGQFLAQAGFWLILIRLQWIWIIFYAAFVAMQLYRSRVEEQVLESAFGDAYAAYKRRTFWFI